MRAAAPASILLLNAFITLRLFHATYIAQMPSIEGAFIGLARYIRDHFPDLSWMPLWYGGIPFPDSYPPLLHATVALVSGVTHISAALAYHAVTALFYSLGPVALYWTLRRMGALPWAAWTASAGYSVFSLTIWAVPEVRHGLGGWWAPCRLDAMVSWGEGPHIASLALLTLAIGAIWSALERRTPERAFAAAAVMAATVLANWIGAFALALIVLAFLVADLRSLWLRLIFIGCWAYALAAPFVTPSTVATVQFNAPLVAAGGFKPNRLLEAACVLAIAALAWALAHWKIERAFALAIAFFVFTAGITLAAYWLHLKVIPQPERYHLEMDLAFWLLAGICLSRWKNPRPAAAIAITAAVCLPVAITQHRRAQGLERPIAIASTAEYETDHWIGGHIGNTRVFAPGTIGFWMQAFNDTPMLTGGFDNGERNTFLPDVIYQVYAGDSGANALRWLRVFGVGAVVGGDPKSREAYHPIAHPEKFAGLPELWRDGPEVVYTVPRRRSSLAHAMRAADLPQVRPPAYDASPLDHYIAALDDPSLPDASFRWRGTGAAEIDGAFQPDNVLSIQVTYDKGWHAAVDGKARPVLEDKLGQMVVVPGCNGPCSVDLRYDGGIEQQSARWLALAASAAGLLAFAAAFKRAGYCSWSRSTGCASRQRR